MLLADRPLILTVQRIAVGNELGKMQKGLGLGPIKNLLKRTLA